MKRFYLIVVAAGCSLLLHAQTNTSGTLPTPRGPTLISSESADFDLARHEATYRGRVRVEDPQMKLACEQLVADVPQEGGHVNHIVAQTNVVIDSTDNKGQTNHVTCDKAVYVYSVQNGVTNETVTLTGNPQPQVENASGTQVADVITWDRANNGFRFDGNYRMVFHQNFANPAAAPLPILKSTNAPAETNEPGTDQPTEKTNLPPVTTDKIDNNLK